MIRLALAQPGTAVLSFDLCCATPVLPVATGRQCSPPRRLLPRETINAPRQQAASVQIPIASDAQLRHTSRGFLLWRFAYAGPTCPPRHHHGAAIRKPSQKRRFGDRSVTSALPQLTDIPGVCRHVSKVPCVDGSELARAFFTLCSIGRCSHVFGLLTR